MRIYPFSWLFETNFKKMVNRTKRRISRLHMHVAVSADVPITSICSFFVTVLSAGMLTILRFIAMLPIILTVSRKNWIISQMETGFVHSVPTNQKMPEITLISTKVNTINPIQSLFPKLQRKLDPVAYKDFKKTCRSLARIQDHL